MKGSKSDIATEAWSQQISYHYGNFSDISRGRNRFSRPVFVFRTENRDRASYSPFALCKVYVFAELVLGHLHCSLTDAPP